MRDGIEITPSNFTEMYSSCEDIISHGSYGEVFKAKHSKDSLDYAVKVIEKRQDSERLMKMFKERFHNLNLNQFLNLGHDNIMQVFNYSYSPEEFEGNIF